MPSPPKPWIPPEAGYPGLPIDDSPPELAKAFQFFSEEIRPRREFRPELGEHGEWRKVEFGKAGGELFPVWETTPWDLKEFGLGVAMYFQTLQLLSGAFLFCGILQAQAISYYKSPEYSDGQPEITGLLRGSAICTRTETVCMDYKCKDIGTANNCAMGMTQAGFDLTMTLVLLLIVGAMSVLQNSVSASLDESLQTAQDYSVIVDDPAPEDSDPEKWAEFFSQFGHVTFVTIAKDNGPLLKALAARRAIMREIIMMIGNGEASVEANEDGVVDTTWDGKTFKTKLSEPAEVSVPGHDHQSDDKSKTRLLLTKTGLFGLHTMEKLKQALADVNAELSEAVEKKPVPSKVFVTFETEVGQRRCLKALSQGTLTAAFDLNKDEMDPAHVFKGTNVLAVQEAPEPAEVFYQDVQVNFMLRLKQQSLTLAVTVVMVFGSVAACKFLQLTLGVGGAALWISITNIAVPIVLRKLSYTVEDHVSLSDQQLSLFLKLTFFRWMNTAVVIYWITDFEQFLTKSAMKQVQAVLFADALTSPLLRTFDPSDAIKQLIVSNYALTQEKMNSYFLGTPWYPAERYADMTKTLFLSLFYSALYPSGLFLTFFGYSFGYTVDKYSLLRTWRTSAELDDSITKTSRIHIAFAVYCHAIMSMIFYAEFPFDNACEDYDAGKLPPGRFAKAQALGVTSDQVFRRCDQSVSVHVLGVLFGKTLENDAMGSSQQKMVRVYGVLVVMLTMVLATVIFGEGLLKGVYHLFYGDYKPETDASDIHFTSCEDIQAFIPIISHPSLPFPLIAADVSTFDPVYLPFELPKKELYQVQSLYNKHELPDFTDEEMKEMFSQVMFFPPPDDLQEVAPVDGEPARQKAKNPSQMLADTLQGIGDAAKGMWKQVQQVADKQKDYEPVEKG